MTLLLGGNYPGAAWLAVYLFHRGYSLQWRPPTRPINSQYLALSYGLHHLLGEPIPAWPIETCLQEIKGFSHWRATSIVEQKDELQHVLRPFQAHILSLADCHRHFQQEISNLQIPESDPEFRPQLAINLWFSHCRHNCVGFERSGFFDSLAAPAGMLEMLSDCESKLICSALNPQQTGFSYWASSQDELAFESMLKILWPEHSFECRDLSWRAACQCWPQLTYSLSESCLDLYIPMPSLQLHGLTQQTIAWLVVQFLARRLGDEFHELSAIPQELEWYLQKVLSVIPNLFKSYKILGIHP